jgi:large subunit ribosomal protein L4e
MKLKILNPQNNEKGSIDMPQVFSEQIRPDIIKRAVEALQANARQSYGSDPLAGKKSSAKLSRRRRDYRGSYGHGISRVPRKIMSHSGTRFNWVGAFAPGTVGGRKAHPPKATKSFEKKINNQERRKAIRSALAATMEKKLVEARGHIAPEKYPFIITNDFETMKKTREVIDALVQLGLAKELERAAEKTYRTGKSRLRGRKYRKRKGPLFVVAKECPLINAAQNIPGVDVVMANALNAELLAPGTVPGRLTLFTEAAIERIAKENMFTGMQMTEKKDKTEKTAKTEKPAKQDKPKAAKPKAVKKADS